jgi:hypothetical protein
MVCLIVKGNCRRRGKVEDIKESTSLAGVSIKMRPRVTNAIILYERYSHTAIVLHLHCSHNSWLSRPFLCVCISFNAADEMVIRCAAATSFRFVSCGLVIRVYANCGARRQQQRRSHTRSILESATRLTSLPRALHNYSARVDFLRKSHATW